jgi:chromosomal replication initiation ATPase DnaA
MVNACAVWHDDYQVADSPRWLSLIGSSGTGKTHCAEKLWRVAKAQADWSRCAYLPSKIYWPDFVQKLRTGDFYAMRNDMKRWPVLFLDDVGAERDPNGFAAEELNTLLGCRVGKWTLLTSNLDLDGIRRIDARLSSRLIRGDNITVGVNTTDYATR